MMEIFSMVVYIVQETNDMHATYTNLCIFSKEQEACDYIKSQRILTKPRFVDYAIEEFLVDDEVLKCKD